MTPVNSVRTLIAVVLVIAIDFYLIHDYLGDGPDFPYAGSPGMFRVAFAGSLPTADLVVVCGLASLTRRGKGRPFLTGFVLSGAAAMFLLMCVALVAPGHWLSPLYPVTEFALKLPRSYRFGLSDNSFLFATEMTTVTVVCSVPELLIALAGGLLARRLSRVRGMSFQPLVDTGDPGRLNPGPHEGRGGCPDEDPLIHFEDQANA